MDFFGKRIERWAIINLSMVKMRGKLQTGFKNGEVSSLSICYGAPSMGAISRVQVPDGEDSSSH